MLDSDPTLIASSTLFYKASPKHCEPITAQKPGTKCRAWSVAVAQAMLDKSEPMGGARVATCNGIAFVARDTNDGKWHGYPESWDKIDAKIRGKWLKEGRISRSDLMRWSTREAVGRAWKEMP